VTFLFEEFDTYDEQAWDKVMTKDGVVAVLDEGRSAIAGVDSWGTESVEAALRAIPERLGIGAGKTFQPMRVAVTGSSVSPPLFESISALGRDKTLQRIDRARSMLS
jgi:glutamyl-tRNA synthetase